MNVYEFIHTACFITVFWHKKRKDFPQSPLKYSIWNHTFCKRIKIWIQITLIVFTSYKVFC